MLKSGHRWYEGLVEIYIEKEDLFDAIDVSDEAKSKIAHYKAFDARVKFVYFEGLRGEVIQVRHLRAYNNKNKWIKVRKSRLPEEIHSAIMDYISNDIEVNAYMYVPKYNDHHSGGCGRF
jgi:hypothetical protein